MNNPATDPAHVQASENALEQAIGRQVRRYRKQLGLTITEMCDRTGLSAGMVSKIENGNTSPSLATLRSLATALNVPVTSLFREFEEQRDATFVKAGQGLAIARSVIVEKHGGSITFETETGRGTTFVIRLPLKDDAEEDEGSSHDAPRAVRG